MCLLCLLSLSVCIEVSVVTTSTLLFPESELVTEPEEEGKEDDTKEVEGEEEVGSAQRGVDCPSLADSEFYTGHMK